LVEVPGVFSQGATLEELDENIQDAYELMVGGKPGFTCKRRSSRPL
jgi:predicted RNase H-like HicB family nuclease